MSIKPRLKDGVEEHRRRIFEYLNPNGTGSLASALTATRSIHLYSSNIHDNYDFSFENTLNSFPKVSLAFGDFLRSQEFHNTDFFRSAAFDIHRKNSNLLLEAQEFLKRYNQLVLRELQISKAKS